MDKVLCEHFISILHKSRSLKKQVRGDWNCCPTRDTNKDDREPCKQVHPCEYLWSNIDQSDPDRGWNQTHHPVIDNSAHYQLNWPFHKDLEQTACRSKYQCEKLVILTLTSPLSTRWHFMPSCLAATAVALQWLDCIPPQVITCLQPFFIASASKNSSFRT